MRSFHAINLIDEAYQIADDDLYAQFLTNLSGYRLGESLSEFDFAAREAPMVGFRGAASLHE